MHFRYPNVRKVHLDTKGIQNWSRISLVLRSAIFHEVIVSDGQTNTVLQYHMTKPGSLSYLPTKFSMNASLHIELFP